MQTEIAHQNLKVTRKVKLGINFLRHMLIATINIDGEQCLGTSKVRLYFSKVCRYLKKPFLLRGN